MQQREIEIRGVNVQPKDLCLSLGWIAGSIVVVFLGLSGLLKLLDLPRFGESLRTWTLIPSFIAPLVTIVVPALEFALLAIYVAVPRFRCRCIWIGLGVLIVYSGAIIIQRQTSSAPDCNCLGLIAQYEWAKAMSERVLIRNSVLMGIAVIALFLIRGGSRGTAETSEQ